MNTTLAGYHNVIAGDVFIHHYGSRSFIGNRIDYGSSLCGNRKVFADKWSGMDAVQRFGKKLSISNAIVRADELCRKGDIEKATASMLEAIQQTPDDRNLYSILVGMLIDAKRYADALGILESLPQGNADARQLTLIGYCEEGLGHEAEAEEYADRALALDGSMAQALNIKGVVAYKKGEKDYAESLFKRAIESVPSLGESYTNLGSLKWDTGEPTEALNLFERGFILSPTVADVATVYHAAVAGSGCFARAEPVFREARALHPNDKRIAFLLIAILIQQEKHDLAMHEIEQAMIQFGIDDGILSAGLDISVRIHPHAAHANGRCGAVSSRRIADGSYAPVPCRAPKRLPMPQAGSNRASADEELPSTQFGQFLLRETFHRNSPHADIDFRLVLRLRAELFEPGLDDVVDMIHVVAGLRQKRFDFAQREESNVGDIQQTDFS